MRRPRRLPFDRRQQAVVALAALTGVLVGLGVAGFERLTTEVLLEQVLERPTWVHLAAPAAGLVATALFLRWLAESAPPGTADDYVRSFHDRQGHMPARPVPGRLLAGVATIGLGGAMGLEGPSIYAGSAIGSGIQRRLGRLFRRDDAKVLLVAGAAAGVSAIFKAPATGVVFALEVPYRDDIAPHALAPSLVASATSYLTFVTLIGTDPLFTVFPAGDVFDVGHLGGALVIGVLAGLGARGFAALVGWAKHLGTYAPLPRRLAVAGAALAALAALSQATAEEPLSLGPGYEVFAWVVDPGRGLWLLALVFFVRLAATAATVAGGGVGGLFIPLAVQGVLLGRFVGGVAGEPAGSVFPVIGIAAFLGAGYRTPIASVMFVAETTGRAAFVVPALVAAAVSQLMMGGASVSATQQSVRAGHLERRFRLPISTAVTADVGGIPPDATISEFVWVHALGRRQRSVPVVDGARYVGMCRLDAAAEVPREQWDTTTVAHIMRADLPVALPSWTLREVVAAMETADVERLAVTDPNGAFVGVVLLSQILELDAILEETGG